MSTNMGREIDPVVLIGWEEGKNQQTKKYIKQAQANLD